MKPSGSSSEETRDKLLASEAAKEVYKVLGVGPEDFEGFSVEKVEAIISANALKLFSARKYIFTDLADIEDVERIQALTSWDAVYLYITLQYKGYKLFDVKEVNKIKALICDDASSLYGIVGADVLDQLADEETEKIKALTSNNARLACNAVKRRGCEDPFGELRAFSTEVIKYLTSGEVLGAYERGLKFSDVAGIEDVEKIKALVEGARRISTEEFTISQAILVLKAFDTEKIKALTSIAAKDIYQKSTKMFNFLQSFEAGEINFLTTNHGFKWVLHDPNMMPFLGVLKGQTKAELESMERERAVEPLKNYIITMYVREKLKGYDEEKITALTTDNALTLYKKDPTTLDLLKDLEVDKIRALTAKYALEVYERVPEALKCLKDLDVRKIEFVESYFWFRSIIITYSHQKDKLFATIQAASADNIEKVLKDNLTLSCDSFVNQLAPQSKLPALTKSSSSASKPEVTTHTSSYEIPTGAKIVGLLAVCAAIVAALYFNSKGPGGKML